MRTPQQLTTYKGREHSLIKHAILKAYLQRFFMIVGKVHPKIAYIDCFAGPWKAKDDEFADSSAGIALKAMLDCRNLLHAMYGAGAQVRALFVERDVEAAVKLQKLVDARPPGAPAARVWQKNFVDVSSEIVSWLEPDEFAFVFVDPFGWKGLVTPAVLAPLLRRPKTELLINFMWNFVNLATGHDSQRANLAELFGVDFEESLLPNADTKRIELMRRYRNGLTQACADSDSDRLRTSILPVEYVSRDAIVFYLVHATHNATGLLTFLHEAELITRRQAAMKMHFKVEKAAERKGMADLFGGAEYTDPHPHPHPLRDQALLDLWLSVLPVTGAEIIVTASAMADLVERGDCAMSDLQRSLGTLVAEGVVQNIDAKGKRRTNIVDWRKSERIVRLK